MERAPKWCPTQGEKELLARAWAEYEHPEIKNIALAAARTEAAGYGIWTRVEEVMEFSRRAGFRHLGIAFCSGLRREARVVQEIFEKNGFLVTSAMCKMGSIPKEELGLRPEEKLPGEEFDPMCNPIAQAMLLNQAHTDFNVLVGLCVGHDSLVIRYAKAPVTVLVAKDRVLGHNPAAALYCRHSYYEGKLFSHPAC
ncbi:MAG TPA: DUF1847 domain-containing protein [Firmicutes bacterium]|nr:DUF1847 domain-containing protein [Bacillota bacterium]